MTKSSRRRLLSASGTSSRSNSGSRSGSSPVRSLSRYRSQSRSASSSSPSRSSPHRKSSTGPAKRGDSPLPPQSKQTSPPPRNASHFLESVVLHVDTLSRNVNEGHLKEIFGKFGEVIYVELVIDRAVNLPKGYAYVEFKARADAEKAQVYMDGGQIDGNFVKAKFTLPSRPTSSAPKRVAQKFDNVDADIEKDGPGRSIETSPQPKSLTSPRKKSPLPRRGGSPRRLPNSSRGHSPSSPTPRRDRSPPRGSPRRIRGSPARRRSPLPPRRRSPPRRLRSPPRRSPLPGRSRSPIRRPMRSRYRSKSLSPRRRRGPTRRRGGSSSSYSSSPNPRKAPRRISRSRSPERPLRGRSSPSPRKT